MFRHSRTNNVSSNASLGVTATAMGALIESSSESTPVGETEEMQRQERLKKVKLKQQELKVYLYLK